MYHLVGNFQNKSGDALVGYYVKLKDSVGAYAALYSDANSTPIATVSGVTNAAVTDATGMYDLWVADGTYDVEFFDKNDMTRLVNRSLAVQMAVPDATLRADLSADTGLAAIGAVGGITAQAALDAKVATATLAAATGSALVGVKQSAALAVTRTVQDKLRDALHAADFLPVGYVTNGTVDYTTQLQAAINEAISSGRELVLPAGTFKVSGSGLSIVTTSNISFAMRGQGMNATFIRNASGPALTLAGQLHCYSDISFYSAGSNYTIIQSNIFALASFHRVSIVQEATGYGVWSNAAHEYIEVFHRNCFFEMPTTSTSYGFNLVGGGGTINDNTWSGCRVQHSGTKQFFNIESTTANWQYANRWTDCNFEVCLGGGIRLRACSGFLIENCQNWDAGTGAIVSHFYDLDRNASNIGCVGKIAHCGRWAGSNAGGIYDVKLPAGGGGAGIIIEDCRTAGGGDPFSIDAANNGIYVIRLAASLCSITNDAGATYLDVAAGNLSVQSDYRVLGTKVVGARDTGWTAMTGTGSKAALAAAAAGTASGAYVQAELQGALNRVAALEARLRSVDAALFTHGLIGA